MKPIYKQEGAYRITVQGSLDETWVSRLGNMRFADTHAKTGVTVIQGAVRDQSELSGILNTLYELHLKLISVEYLGKSELSSA